MPSGALIGFSVYTVTNMFKFDFDIDDAEDNGFGPVVGPDTASAQTEQGQPETAVVEHSSREVSLDDLVIFLVLGTSKSFSLTDAFAAP